MNIFDRPPTIAEDVLHYTIHPGPLSLDRSAVIGLETVLQHHVSSLLPGHIWHRDTFELNVVGQPNGRWTIEGHMRVGDCIDDEWCVVWLLRGISQRWDVVVSLRDNDGEFLLIEAAEYLPSWITPENSQNRVWIFKGHLHIIPLKYTSTSSRRPERHTFGTGSGDEQHKEEDTVGYISFSDAVDLIHNQYMDTLASPDVEKAAFLRTEGYPQVARQHSHRTKVYIPRDISLALAMNPFLIQKATEAFYTRDVLQLRTARRMARFKPDSSILATVTMSRPAYAQLMGQKFYPPKVFGLWKEKEGTPEWRWRDIGMKIACGFEMLYQESNSKNEIHADRSYASAEACKEALSRDPDYVRYIKHLQNFGFFKDELGGSAMWREREIQAATQYLHARQSDNSNRPSFTSQVDLAISQAQARNQDPCTLSSGEEDPDDWLVVSESMLEKMFSSRSQTMTVLSKTDRMDVDQEQDLQDIADKQAEEQASQLRGLASKIESFVEGRGDVEGATFDDDLLSDEADMSEFSDSDDDDESVSNAQEKKDVSAFASERQVAMDKLVPALEPSEYGVMPPSFHVNSQKVKEASFETHEANEERPRTGEYKPPDQTQTKPIRPLIFPRDQFDGVVDSDDESEEDVGGTLDDEDEDRPTVVGEVEIDMNEEEEEFLKFSRDALGISPEMWSDIVRERKGRGAFLPQSALRDGSAGEKAISSPMKTSMNQPDSEPPANRNPDLSSFESVMQAMDAELLRAKRGNPTDYKTANVPSRLARISQSNEKGKKEESDENDVDAAMDAELRAALQDFSDKEDSEGETTMDYTLIKNFLESFKSQQGLSGPVGNLVSRLGWQLPRDES